MRRGVHCLAPAYAVGHGLEISLWSLYNLSSYFFSVTISKKEWKVVPNLTLNEHAKRMLKTTGDELVSEKAEAMSILK